MGIPSYFSYIIKNHSNIIRNRKQLLQSACGGKFHSLYMDCNSIIYDAVYSSSDADKQLPNDKYEDLIISRVILKINSIIATIQPSKTAFIAFDGVAPFAKMGQQRIRRYKTAYMASLDFHCSNGIGIREGGSAAASQKWSTSAITPGTRFMNKLSTRLKKEYRSTFTNGSKWGVEKIILSTSDEPGEGEHKMFEYMRKNKNAAAGENIAVYGLDSDLIMLSVFHCLMCDNIWICRESPEFAKSVLPKNVYVPPNELLFLDIRGFSRSLLRETKVSPMTPSFRNFETIVFSDIDNCRIYDYVFMCFLLGNDFLPHFPALNIRTDGMGRIMDAYAKCISNTPERTLISPIDGKIQWNYVKILLTELAANEHTFIMQEYAKRDKLEKSLSRSWTMHVKTPEDKEQLFSNAPILFRAEEKYICPSENCWEQRYYETLFSGEEYSQQNIEKICLNYIEGLEWVFRYYTNYCCHWKWKYHYNYPPLLIDLIKYLPSNSKYLFTNPLAKENRPMEDVDQLAYVLPAEQHYLLPTKKLAELMKDPEKYAKQYPKTADLEFEWAFCRYFWEAHPKI